MPRSSMSKIERARTLRLRRSTFTDDEGHGALFGQARLSGDSARQHLDGFSAHLIPRYPNGGQAREKLRGEFSVTVSRDRDIFGNPPPAPLTFLNTADGEHVARKEHRIDRRIPEFEDIQRLRASRRGDGHLDFEPLGNDHVPAPQGLSVPDPPLPQRFLPV